MISYFPQIIFCIFKNDEISSITNVEDNSLIFINYYSLNKIDYKQVLQKYEPNFNTMITLIKQPVRFLQFTFKTEGYRQKFVNIKCENESGDDNIAIIDVIPGNRQTCHKNFYDSQIVKTKLCANDKYVLIVKSNEKHSKVN